MDSAMPDLPSRRPAGFRAIGLFFLLGAAMASLAAVTLLFPGTFLDHAWVLNPVGYVGLSTLGRWIGLPFFALAAALLLAGAGWLKRRRWGWVLGVSVIAVNLAGDVVHLATGDWRGGVGVLIAGMLFFYLTRKTVRQYFGAPG